MTSLNSFNTLKNITIDNRDYKYFDLNVLSDIYNFELSKIPNSTKILIENLIRNEDGEAVTKEIISDLCKKISEPLDNFEISFSPTRVLMQDFTGVPAVADLAAMRDALRKKGINPSKINPLSRVDLIIDHSVMVDHFGNNKAYEENVKKEFDRNKERYEFLKWGQKTFDNFYLAPPGGGICHQVNLENIAKTIWSKETGNEIFLYPDSVVGTDSHTTMVNALSVLGWGVGGIEAEAAMLGQPISMNIPKVVGFKLVGQLQEGITATDLVLTITEILRKKGVVGKFVEFFGEGLKTLSLADRSTISNMAPEYGATCGFFSTDEETLNYLKLSGKDEHHLNIVKEYTKLQKLWIENDYDPNFDEILHLDLTTIQPSVAGPKRPQDKILVRDIPNIFRQMNNSVFDKSNNKELQSGDIVIAAITSCTNTSNPNVMVAAGLVAKKAVEFGLTVKPWVKTSLAPGSKVVSDYLDKSELSQYLDKIGFNLVGYGCTTCIGNSGPLNEWVSKEIKDKNLTVCSVLSGNRNFEGRVHQEVKANFLASPPLVVAFAIAGNMNLNLFNDPIGISKSGHEVFLKDLWPSTKDINKIVDNSLSTDMFLKRYEEIYSGDQNWKLISSVSETTYKWNTSSTYIKHPPFFENEENEVKDIVNARILAILGDSVTTDHISPAGAIKPDSPAGKYLNERQINRKDFNSYGSRRGNHEIMMRGTFANIRIKNEIIPGTEGGITKFFDDKDLEMSIYDAAIEYSKKQIPLVIFAGKEYGTGSSRDWAAKGTKLLGIKAVIAESFERIHRSNLIGMGVLPLQFISDQNRKSLNLIGDEMITIKGLNSIKPNEELICEIKSDDIRSVKVLCRIDTIKELDYYNQGGILQYVLNSIIKKAS